MAVMLVFLNVIGQATAATTAETLDKETLQAIVRSLGFLETVPTDNRVEVAVVYGGENPQGLADAEDVASQLSNRPGPKKTKLRAMAIRKNDLPQFQNRIDVMVLMPGTAGEETKIAEIIRLRRILSIASEPVCLTAGSCVLMVNAEKNVEIILDTQLAKQVGAQFSSVFTMMVKRK